MFHIKVAKRRKVDLHAFIRSINGISSDKLTVQYSGFEAILVEFPYEKLLRNERRDGEPHSGKLNKRRDHLTGSGREIANE